MRKLLFSSLAGLLAGSSLVVAQDPPALPPPVAPPALQQASATEQPAVPPSAALSNIPPAPLSGAPNVACDPPDIGSGTFAPHSRVYFSAEYLLWWLKDGGTPGLVGAAPPGTASGTDLPAGAIQTLFGSPVSNINYKERSGLRLTAGFWIDPEQTWAIEASYFRLEKANAHFDRVSTGAPVIGPLFFDPVANRQVLLFLADPGRLTGLEDVRASGRLWGAEGNARWQACSLFSDRIDLFLGFRYLDLDESLQILSNTLFAPDLGGRNITWFDSFKTRNQFYGPQLGFTSDYRVGRFFANLTGKLAVGDMHENVDILGGALSVNVVPAPTFESHLGGILAQPTNIGSHGKDRISVIPELTLNLGVDITERARVFIGYNFLYINNVARPGDQIDGVDGRQVQFTSTFDPTVHATRPALVSVHNTDFWAQGVNVGLEFHY
jgi:hypothetical protein